MIVNASIDLDEVTDLITDRIRNDRYFVEEIADEVVNQANITSAVETEVVDYLDTNLAEAIAVVLAEAAEDLFPAQQAPAPSPYMDARIAALETQVGRLIEALDAAQKIIRVLADTQN